MEHRPPTRTGLLVGLGMLLALILLEIGLIVLVLTAPITPLSVLRSVLILLILPLMGAVLYGLYSLNNACYALDRNALVIRWGAKTQIIPLTNVDGVLQGMDLGRAKRFRGLRWPGFRSGRGQIENLGQVRYYCTAPWERQLVLQTPAGAYAISPENADRFMDRLVVQQAMGPAEELEQVLLQPALRHSGLFSDRLGHSLLALGGLLNLALFAFLASHLARLPHTIPLHFDLSGTADRLGSPNQLLVMAGLGTAAWLVDSVLGALIYQRTGERIAAYLLWVAAVCVQILLLAAAWQLVRV